MTDEVVEYILFARSQNKRIASSIAASVKAKFGLDVTAEQVEQIIKKNSFKKK